MSESLEAQVDKWLSETETPADTTTTEPTTETPANEPSPTDPAPEGQTPVDGKAPAQPKDPAGEPAKPGSGEKPATDKNAQQRPSKHQPGDLVDPRTGEVIAKAGAERRHFETAQRATRELGNVRQQLERTSTELNAFRQAAQLPTQLGLSPDETAQGLQLVASWKQNPVGVVKYLVEQAQAMGHNIEGLTGAADMGAIRTMIERELMPFRQQAQMGQAQQEAHTAAQAQIQDLIGAYGQEALVNSDALSKLIDAGAAAGQAMTLEQAYSRFSNWCYKNGLDPHQPIDPQIEARSQAPQAPAPTATNGGMPPRPNGRAGSAMQPMTAQRDVSAGMTGMERNADIVRAAMRDAGLNT